jgi:FkbM family methyltransferase
MVNKLIAFLKKIIKKLLPKSWRSFIEKNFKKYHSANGLDKKMLNYLNYENGYYVEIGANDGVLQSNTLFFEKYKNWRGILIEPIKDKYQNLIKNRNSKNIFYNKALVSFEYEKNTIKLIYSDLMTTIKDNIKIDINKQLQEGDRHLNFYEKKEEFVAETSTLNDLLDSSNAPNLIDFFSLDTEGYEKEILKGIDFNKYNFKFLLVECINNFDEISFFLKKKNYEFIEKLSHIDYLFKFKN